MRLAPLPFPGLLLVPLALTSLASPAAEVSRYQEEIRLEEGGRATVTLVLDVRGQAGETVRIPFGHAGAEASTFEVREARAVRVEKLPGERRLLAIDLGDQGKPVEVRFGVPDFLDWKKTRSFGNRSFSHGFVNATSSGVGRYEGVYLLPPGHVVGSVVETVPAESESGPGRPYEVVRLEGRDGLRLSDESVPPGDTVRAVFKFKPARRPGFFLGALACVAAAYLVGFRDLVRRAP